MRIAFIFLTLVSAAQMLPNAIYANQSSALQSSSQCELHVCPTRAYGAIFHGATASYAGPGAVALTMYNSPMDRVRDEMRRALDPDVQNRLIEAVLPSVGSPLIGYKIILHEAPKTQDLQILLIRTSETGREKSTADLVVTQSYTWWN